MKYTFQQTVSYQEVDQTRRLRLFQFENMLLQVAGDVANQLGFGVKQLLPYGYTWILSRMDIQMKELPTHGDLLTFETWIEQNAHMLSTRDYHIYLGNDTQAPLIGQVSSVWAVLDLNQRQAVNAFDLPMFKDCVDGTPLRLERLPRMLPLTEPQGEKTATIQYSDIDYNGHCNSCKYLEHMLNAHRPSFMAEPTPFRLTIQYSKEVMEGTEILIRFKESQLSMSENETKNNVCQWQIQNAQGETSATARLIAQNLKS